MRRRLLAGAALLMVATPGLVVAPAIASVPAVAVAGEVTVHTGVIDGAKFRVEVPSRWNGTLLLFSHGFYTPGFVPEEIALVNQPAAQQRLLETGYALAASLYRTPDGYSVQQALQDQIRLLDWFDVHVGRPEHVVSWGASGGGLISVLLAERNPGRIDGVLPMCGPVGGGPGLMNQLLDLAFTIRTLLAPDGGLQLVRITDPAANEAAAAAVVQEAMSTPQGRARLALANALASIPGWSRALEPRPATVADQVAQAATYDLAFGWLVWGSGRSDVEARAGGNPSWNIGVDYRRQLARSTRRDLVERAYREAGLDLRADLARLNAAPRVRADGPAVQWLARYGEPTGRTRAPVLALHPVGDVIAPEHERRYAEQVARSGGAARLRQLFVNRGGHCMHTAAEELAALAVLDRRMRTGRWPATGPAVLNGAAARYGPDFHLLYDWLADRSATSPPAFVTHRPGPFLRPALS